MIIPCVDDDIYDKILNKRGKVISKNVYKFNHIQSIRVLYNNDFSKIYVGEELIRLEITKSS